MAVEKKVVEGVDLKLTKEQQEAIKEFWQKTGSMGRIELKVDVVGDKISPASIQVGTAK